MRGATILVVDDDRRIQALVMAALQEEGYRVQAAFDGAALELARREPPDLLLLDVQMPVMDGVEMSRHLRAHPATASIPIVAMTANLEYARRHGMQADAWLAKPFDLEALYETVTACLHRSSGHSQGQTIG